MISGDTKTLKFKERSAFIARLSLTRLLFIILWVVCISSPCFCRLEITDFQFIKASAVIFMTTEGWALGNILPCLFFFGHCSDPILRFFFIFSRSDMVRSHSNCASPLNIHAGEYAPQTQAGRSIFIFSIAYSRNRGIYSKSYRPESAITSRNEMIKPSSSTDGSIAFTRQLYADSRTDSRRTRTDTMVDTPDPESYPVASHWQLRNVTFLLFIADRPRL